MEKLKGHKKIKRILSHDYVTSSYTFGMIKYSPV